MVRRGRELAVLVSRLAKRFAVCDEPSTPVIDVPPRPAPKTVTTHYLGSPTSDEALARRRDVSLLGAGAGAGAATDITIGGRSHHGAPLAEFSGSVWGCRPSNFAGMKGTARRRAVVFA
jgi:hypothetical protein